jgi:hypothetical protein
MQNARTKTRTGITTATTLLSLLMLAGVSTACAPEIGGKASFPLLSRAQPLAGYENVTTIDEKRCTHVILGLVAWGDDANHEALITDLLSKHKGDAIAYADLTFFSIPALFYNQNCARVTGTIVRRSGGGGAAAAGGRPATEPSPPPVKPAEGVSP